MKKPDNPIALQMNQPGFHMIRKLIFNGLMNLHEVLKLRDFTPSTKFSSYETLHLPPFLYS